MIWRKGEISRARFLGGVVVACAMAASALSMAGRTVSAASAPTITVVSMRADLIAGGTALVSVTLPSGTAPSSATVTLNGVDVTSEFAVRPNGLYEGLVSGLSLGASQLVVTIPGGGAQITITNSPNGGPLFSGPQIQPWTCLSTPVATDAQCDAPVTYTYEYMPAGANLIGTCMGTSCVTAFQSYDPSNPPPSQAIATTTTDNGHTVPYIIRIETGAEDRSQYSIAVLFTPGAPWDPWAPQPQWDGKLEYMGGSGCGFQHGESTPPSVLDTVALALGYAVESTALGNEGADCNLVPQAESVVMAKAHFIDAYGPVRYTIATGGSGGSVFIQQVANEYPGLFDGLVPMASFSDNWSSFQEGLDCALLLSYFDNTSSAQGGVAWTPTQQASVAGDTTTTPCNSWVNVFGFNQLFNPASGSTPPPGVACGITPAQRYSAQTNPTGVRCDMQDFAVNVFGTRPSSAWGPVEQQIHQGFANRAFDNVGRQFGLSSLLAGTITAQQFADLNSKLGGYDIDLNATAARSAADPAALTAVYRGGDVNEAAGLSTVPILDVRGHDDYDIHEDFRSYVMRLRLDNSNGGHANQAIWTGPVALLGFAANSSGLSMSQEAFLSMDQWLHNIEQDTGSASPAQKVINDKPPAATDTCFDAAGNPIPVQSTCSTLYPYSGSPRIGAGGPLADDIIKCQLQPLDRGSYGSVTFTDAQWAEMQAAFPAGVCNYGLPGVGQSPGVPWLTYTNGPGGQPLGAPPVSTPTVPANVAETFWTPAFLVLALGVAAARGRSRRRRTS